MAIEATTAAATAAAEEDNNQKNQTALWIFGPDDILNDLITIPSVTHQKEWP